MKEISKQRFDCLAGYARSPMTVLIVEEVGWYASDDERVLILLVLDRQDKDFGWIAMGRDERMRYRAVDVRSGFASFDAALDDLPQAVVRLDAQPDEEFHQGDGAGRAAVDFFAPLAPPERLNSGFKLLAEATRFRPARDSVAAMMRYHEDVDGNFVQLFQTTGFDARLWELYLFATMTELGYARKEGIPAPDFVLTSPFGDMAIEATSANPPHRVAVNMPTDKDGFIKYLQNYVPIKLAKALNRKLRHQPPYWSKPELRDIPFVLAVQDFHRAGSTRMVVPAATEFVFGVRHWPCENGIRVERLAESAGVKIPQ